MQDANYYPITNEWLTNIAGFEYDNYTYAKERFWLAPHSDGRYDLFLNGLQGRITCTILFQYQLEDLYEIITGEKLIK